MEPTHLFLSCNRFGFMWALQAILLTTTAQLFLTIRVYAITRKNKLFPYFSALVLVLQWAIALYIMSKPFRGSDLSGLLLLQDTPLSTLPNIDTYKICLFLSIGPDVAPYVKAFLFLSLVFDALAFVIIISVTITTSRCHGFMPLTKVIQRDGVIYFFVLFSSNLVWVLLWYRARSGLKLMHSSQALIISAIMINRITLNLKKASQRNSNGAWSIATFELLSSDTEMQASRSMRDNCTYIGEGCLYGGGEGAATYPSCDYGCLSQGMAVGCSNRVSLASSRAVGTSTARRGFRGGFAAPASED